MGKDGGGAGWALSLGYNPYDYIGNNDYVELEASGYGFVSSAKVANGVWTNVTATLISDPIQNNAQATIYINGWPSATNTLGKGYLADDSTDVAYLANAESIVYHVHTTGRRCVEDLRASWC